MHSVAEVGTNVPAFLAKLWKLVEDPATNNLICWSENGDGFVIHNQAQFCRELLPLYYKHNNMASFVRQLNMYGFHKKVSVDAGGLKLDRDEMEFAHPCFLRGQAYLLENIKRKIAETGRGTFKTPEVISRVLGDVKQMKGRQENLDTKLSSMKRENEALWRELAMLRQKHHKQQQIVNKLTTEVANSSAMQYALTNSPHIDDDDLTEDLSIQAQLIQFLLTVVQSPGSRLGIKRCYPPLMLNDKEHHHHHHHKHKHRHGHASSSVGSPDHLPASAPATPISHRHGFSDDEAPKIDDLRSGPTIHELDPNTEYILPDQQRVDDEEEEEEEEDIEEVIKAAAVVRQQVTSPVQQATVTSPSPTSMADIGEPSQSPVPPMLDLELEQEAMLNPEALLDDTTSASMPEITSNEPSTSRLALLSSNGNSVDDSQSSSVSRWGGHPLGEELDNHLESMQTDLDGLKELLRNENCSLDANTLLSLFADDPISLGMGLPSQEGKDDDADIIGSELIQYNPTLFDLTDDGSSEASALFPEEAEKLLQSDEASGLEAIVKILTTDSDLN